MLNGELFTIRNFVVIGGIAIVTKMLFKRALEKLDGTPATT